MMNSYESLVDKISDNITVVEKKFKSKAKGLCKGNKIGISIELTSVEKRCVLAEELGHIKLTVGDITNLNNICNVKQEILARRWAHSVILPFNQLINASTSGVCTKYELIDYLDVTEEFFDEAINHYKQKYGHGVYINNYIIIFEPIFCIYDVSNSFIDAPL